MRLRLNLSLRRALMAAMAVATTLASSAWAGVVDARYDQQYYLDFSYNKGMFAAGASNILVKYANGDSVTNPTISLMPNLDSYGLKGKVIGIPGVSEAFSHIGGAGLVAPQYVMSASHCGETDIYFLTENEDYSTKYTSSGYHSSGGNWNTDWSIQRLNKIVTEVAYTPYASNEFIGTLKVNDWLYRLGHGTFLNTDGQLIDTAFNALGGLVNISSITKIDANTWQIKTYLRENDTSGDTRPPLEIGAYSGDSGSPVYAWDEENRCFVQVAFASASTLAAGFGNDLWARYNATETDKFIDSCSISVSEFSGDATITWSTQDAATGKGTLTQGDKSVEYVGYGTANGAAGQKGLTFTTTDTENTLTLAMQGSVNMGAGALTFDSGSWLITEAQAIDTFNSAGFVVNKGASVTLNLTATANEEWRKVGAGILTIAGEGANDVVLRVGGGTTVYDRVYDAEGNQIGWTLGNEGETRLNRQNGYAASSVRLEAGVAIIVLMADNQFKTKSVAGDTFTFGNDGGLLNLNGHDLEWGVINQDGSGTGARIGNFTPLGEETPGSATFTYTGTGTFEGCFVDESIVAGDGKAALAVTYRGGREDKWTLTGNHSNVGGFTVEGGTMVLEGSNTPHVNMVDKNDWTYASLEGSDVTVKNGATFQLSHHAVMSGNVNVQTGGIFELNQTVNALSESVDGSLRQNMEEWKLTSLVGNVTLADRAAMLVNTNSPVATTMQGNISGTSSATFTKTGNGVFVLDGQMLLPRGEVSKGGVVVNDATGFVGSFTSWTVGEAGFLAVKGLDNAKTLACIKEGSKGVLALTSNQATGLVLKEEYVDWSDLYIGAWGDVTYGTAGASLTAYGSQETAWRLGGGTGTLTVDFKLEGGHNLYVGNQWSSGTVHLTNTENDIGAIYIQGTGNRLTYVEGALGDAMVHMGYGNALGLYQAEQMEILSADSQGVLALSSSLDLDLSTRTGSFSIGAIGDLTYTGTVTAADDTYRFGGLGNLTLDTVLSGVSKMQLDGQGMEGSSVTFARENAYEGAITAGGALQQENAQGNIALHAGHEKALAAAKSVTLKQGATLYSDGQNIEVKNLTLESGSALVNNGYNTSSVTLNVDKNVTTRFADGVLNNSSSSAQLNLVKTGEGTLTMATNADWTGTLTISQGTVEGSLAFSGLFTTTGGIGSHDSVIYVEKDGVLRIDAANRDGRSLGGTEILQTVLGTGTIEFSSGGSAVFSTQSQSFEGTIRLLDNTRLYVGSDLNYDGGLGSYNSKRAVNNATIEVTDGSQVRITSTLYLNYTHQETVNTNFIISGDGFDGSVGSTDVSGIDSLRAGALAIDCNSVVNGNITLAADAMISSSSGETLAGKNRDRVTSSGNYGVAGYLGGTIRGHIGGDFTLTFGGNESMTITADSANTYGDLVIANGNGHNGGERVFALCLDAGKAENQVSTALGTGTVTLNDGLILRLAGTGTENQSNVEYTYKNDMKVGKGSTIQSYNITNVLARTVEMKGDSLNLATAKGGVLHLAGGVQGTGTLNVAANSTVILGSSSAAMGLTRDAAPQFSGSVVAGAGADITLASASVVAAGTQFSGADSLTLRFGGTADYALGGITLSGDDSALTLHFDFSTVPSASLADSYTTLRFATGTGITASNTTIAIDLNLYNELANGTYTLIGSANSTTTYSLADSLNGRLQLDTFDGTVKLIVGADQTFYWGANGASQNWTGDANWYQPSSGSDLIAFTGGSHLVLNELGVAQDNSAAAPESIALSGTQQVGKMVVKDAVFYQLTGEGAALSGTSLVVGEGANLELSSTGTHTFTEGVYVDGATLAITAGSLADNVTVSEGTLSVSGATVNDRIIVPDDLSGGAVLSGLNNVAPSLTVSHFADSGTTMSLTSGKLSFDQGMNINKLSLGASTEAVLQNAGLTDGLTKHIGTLEMGAGATLSLDNRTQSGTTDAADIGEVVLTGKSATIKEVYGAGYLKVGTLSMAEGVTSATLTLQKSSVSATSPYTTIFEFGSADAEAGNFVGVVNMSQNQPHSNNNNGTKHSVFVNLSGAETFANAVVRMDEQVVPNAYLGLGINAGGEGDSTTIAGLVSSKSLGNRAFVFSGYAPQDINWNTDVGFDKNAGEVARTLIINTAKGESHAFYGQIRDQLSLVKKGAGKQSFLGESSVFNGNITIEAGTLAFNSAGAGLISRAASVVVKDGATLDLSAIDFDSSVNAISIGDSHALTFESGATLALGDLEQNRFYNIFTSYGDLNGWNADVLSAENVSINGDKLSDTHRAGYITLLYGVDGSFSYTLESADLTWQGGINDNWDTTTANWDITPDVAEDATRFYQYDNVVFRDTAATTVTLSEDIVAGRVDIQDDHDHTFKGAAKSLVVDTLTSKGKVVVGAGEVFSLTINESSDIDKDLDVYWGATLNLKGLNHDINKLITRAGFSLSSAVNFNALSATIGEIEMKNNSDIVFGLAEGANSADYTVTNNINVNTNETTSRTITVEKGASLSATKLINTHGLGTLDVDGTMSLSDKLEYTNSGNKNAVAVQSITGDGSLTVGSADFANASNTLSVHTFTVNGATNINSGSLTIAGGVVNLNGTTNKTGGTLTVQGGELNFNGTTTLDSLTAAGGTTNFNGATTLTSASFNGGTVNFATNYLTLAGFSATNNAAVNFKQAAGATRTTYALTGAITTQASTITIDEGVEVYGTSYGSNNQSKKTLCVNGELNLSGSMDTIYGDGTEICGAGTINVGQNVRLHSFGYNSIENISVAKLNIGGNLIFASYHTNPQFNFIDGITTVTGSVQEAQLHGASTHVNVNIKGGELKMMDGGTFERNTLNISAGALTQAGGNSSIAGVFTMTGGELKVTDGTMSISSNTFSMTGGELKVTGGTMSISSTPTVSGGAVSITGGSLALTAAAAEALMGTAGATFTLDGGTLDLSALTFDGTADNAIALGSTSGLTLSSGTIKLGALQAGTEYQIFSFGEGSISGWDALTVSNFRIGDKSLDSLGNVTLELGADGTFMYTLGAAGSLYWDGGATGNWNTTATNWDATAADGVTENNNAFHNGDSAIFNSSANVTVTEAVSAQKLTVRDGATVSITETAALTASTIEVQEGATLAFKTKKDGYTAGNMTGEGTVELALSGTGTGGAGSSGWENKVQLGTEFGGKTYITSGNFDLCDASVGSELRLAHGVNANAYSSSTTLSANLVLEGTSYVHANSTYEITYNGGLTGTQGDFRSSGGGTHTFNGTVNINKFETAGGATVKFKASTTINTLNVTQGTVNFNGATDITTANISGGTTNFSTNADIDALNISGGTVAVTVSDFGHAGDTITMTGGTLDLKLATAQTNQTLLSALVVNNANGGTSYLKNSAGAETMKRTLTSVSIAAGNTLEVSQTNWNTFWYINDLSGAGNLTWNSNTTHYTASHMVFKGNGSDFTGTITLNRNKDVEERSHQAYMEIAENDAVKGATLDLTGNSATSVASLAINAAQVTMQGLKGNEHAHLYAGAAPTGIGTGNSDHSNVNHAVASSAANTLTIAGSGEYTFAGTVGTANDTAHLSLAMTGTGKQTFSGTTYLGNVTVSNGELVLSGAANAYGAVSVSNGTLTLGADAKGVLSQATGLTLSGTGVLDLSAIVFNTEDSTDATTITLSNGALFDFAASRDDVNDLIIKLGDLQEGVTYRLFDTTNGGTLRGWDDATLDLGNFCINGTMLSDWGEEGGSGTLSLTFGDDGTFRFAYEALVNDMVWTGGEEGKWNATDENWDNTPLDEIENKEAYITGSGATFESNASVTLEGAVEAAWMIVAEDTEVTLNAADGASLTAESIDVYGTLNLNTAATAELVWVEGTLSADASNLVNLDNIDVSYGGTLNIDASTDTTLTANLNGLNEDGEEPVLNGILNKTGNGTLTWDAADDTLSVGTLNISAGGLKTMDTLTVGTLNAEGTTILSGLYEAETVNVNGGNIKLNYVDNNATSESGKAVIGTLEHKDGTLTLSGELDIDTMRIAANKTTTVYNATQTSTSNKVFGTLEMGAASKLVTYNKAGRSYALNIDVLQVNGTGAELTDAYHSGHVKIGKLDMGDSTEALTLKLQKGSDSDLVSRYEFGSADAEAGDFRGRIEVSSVNKNNRPLSIILSGSETLSGAVIDFVVNAGVSNYSYLGLGINTTAAEGSTPYAAIAGLESDAAMGLNAKVYSGTIEYRKWDSNNQNNFTNSALRTLKINTVAANGAHNFYGEVLANLNLEIAGTGTQNFLGASSSFSGSMTLTGGTMGFNEAGSSLLDRASGVTLGNGTVKAVESFSIANAADVVLNGTGTGTVFDTNGKTITVDSKLTGSGKLVKNGEGDLKLTAANTYTGGTTINTGSLTITHAQALGGSDGTLGKLNGSGTLVIDMADDSTRVFATGSGDTANLGAFKGTVDVQSGIFQAGAINTDGAGASNTSFEASKIIVGADGEFVTHFGFGTDNQTAGVKTFSADMDLMDGAVLTNIDGHVNYTGNIRFNVQADGTSKSTGMVKIDQYWQKTLELSGLLEGDGTVRLCNPFKEDKAVYKITGQENTFAGTFETREDDGVSASRTIEIRLGSETAAQFADVSLTTATVKSYLMLDSDATIHGLYGVADADNAVQAQDAARTLTVSEGDFAASLQDGTGTLALTKQSSGKLTLSGANAYTGATTVTDGTLELRGAGQVGTGNVSIASGAQLTAATTATADTASETWAAITANEGTTASLQGATITQTENSRTLSIASKTADTQGTMTNSLVQLAAGASLTVDNMLISDSSRIAGATAFAAREAAVTSAALTNSTIALGAGNATVGQTEALTLTSMQVMNPNAVDGTLTLSGAYNVLTVNSDALSNLLIQSGSSFVVDFNSLLTGTGLADVDFVCLEFADTSFAAPANTTISGLLGDEQLTAYYQTVQDIGVATPNVGVYFDVRYIPEPTSSTLSILALAALAARRRRK